MIVAEVWRHNEEVALGQLEVAFGGAVARLFSTWIWVSQNPRRSPTVCALGGAAIQIGICRVSPSPGRSLLRRLSGATCWLGLSNFFLEAMMSISSSTSFHTRSALGLILPMNESVLTSLNFFPHRLYS